MRGGRLQGIKCIIVIVFMITSTMSFLKPYIHMNTDKNLTVDNDKINQLFDKLEKFTVSFGFSLGILAYSTVLCQMTAVPELMINEKDYNRDGSAYHEYFKLPLFIANIGAFTLKWCFAVAGAMTFTDSSNLFNGLLFNKT